MESLKDKKPSILENSSLLDKVMEQKFKDKQEDERKKLLLKELEVSRESEDKPIDLKE